MTDAIWIEDLLTEKSLWEARKVAARFPPKKFDQRIRWVFRTVGPLAILVVFCLTLSSSQEAELVKALASTVLAFCSTVLGFLVTGLAIFATLSGKKIWIELAKTHLEDEGVSAFKYMFFNLLAVFILFLFAIASSAAIFVAASAEADVPSWQNGSYIVHTASWVNGVALTFLGLVFLETIIRLKSFIWNLYSTFVSMLTVASIVDTQS